ncbi:hypothetical protein FQR65_LT11388 [Abscondita terminalis]|nr:hypothetical protein FQR65_LT11388 [Abscondita terminalis]
MVNFSMLEILQRLHRIQCINDIMYELQDDIIFPRERHRKLGNLEFQKYSSNDFQSELLSYDEIEQTIMEAKENAEHVLSDLGIEIENDEWMNISIPNVHDHNKHDELDELKESSSSDVIYENSNEQSNTHYQRVKGPKQIKDNNKQTIKKKKKKRLESDSDSLEEDHLSPIYDDSEDSETFSDVENISSSKAGDISLAVEKYYAVAYHDTWYIGRILEANEKESKVKFLKFDLDRYIWPQKEDVQVVHNTYIFEGPISLTGTYPFFISGATKKLLDNKYKCFKRSD